MTQVVDTSIAAPDDDSLIRCRVRFEICDELRKDPTVMPIWTKLCAVERNDVSEAGEAASETVDVYGRAQRSTEHEEHGEPAHTRGQYTPGFAAGCCTRPAPLQKPMNAEAS